MSRWLNPGTESPQIAIKFSKWAAVLTGITQATEAHKPPVLIGNTTDGTAQVRAPRAPLTTEKDQTPRALFNVYNLSVWRHTDGTLNATLKLLYYDIVRKLFFCWVLPISRILWQLQSKLLFLELLRACPVCQLKQTIQVKGLFLSAIFSQVSITVMGH